ncbi:DUF2625 family protein [Streptomyces sp. NPDC051183]|uniref:DUF2625 family protein n=1 Tax=Streptomyces sp. NPDC051183 TaxID=3155165 RepID=UPI003416E808
MVSSRGTRPGYPAVLAASPLGDPPYPGGPRDGLPVRRCGNARAPFVDSGWLRISGSPNGAGLGGPPSPAEVNAMPAAFDPAWHAGAGLVVAHDVLGGAFVLNGAIPVRPVGPVNRARSSTSPPTPSAGRPWAPATRHGCPGFSPEGSRSSTRTCDGTAGATRSPC